MSRHWSTNAAALNALASEYVLGTLQGRARRRFEALVAQRADLAERVAEWEARLHRMAQMLPPVEPPPALWAALAQQAGLPAEPAAPVSPAAAVAGPLAGVTPTRTGLSAPAMEAPSASASASTPTPATAAAPTAAAGPSATPAAAAAPARRATTREPSLLQRLSRFAQALLAPVPAGALALGLLGGLVIPQVFQAFNPPTLADTELPESYVGVLAAADGRPGLIVASRRYGRVVDLKQVRPVDLPAGQTLFLWTIDAQGRAAPVGPVPSGPFVQAPLADVAEKVFASAVELGVTLEAVGSTPSADAPGRTWLFRGLCGKVWRVPPAAPQPAASKPAAG